MPYHYGWAAKDGHGLYIKQCQLGSFCMIWKNYCEMRGSHDTQHGAHLVAHQATMRQLVVFFSSRFISRKFFWKKHTTVPNKSALTHCILHFGMSYCKILWCFIYLQNNQIYSGMQRSETKHTHTHTHTKHYQLKSGKYMRSNPGAGVLWRLSAMARRGYRPRRHRQ